MSAWQFWPVRQSGLLADGRAQREALYDGALLRHAPTPSSEGLVSLAQSLLVSELGTAPREAIWALPGDELFRRLGRIRRALYCSADAHALIRSALTESGWDASDVAFDPARLRVIHPRGELIEAASAVYAVHRDIWYGHPSSLITWWIPLDDLSEDQTFEVWPDLLHVPVANDSEVFDYDTWVAAGWSLKIGWQDPEAGRTARYPGFLGRRDALGPGVGFSCQRGESRLFSGAHLHATRPHDAPRTRFSLDLRVVSLTDVREGRGAPAVDNRSRGSSVRDYVQPGDAAWHVGADPG